MKLLTELKEKAKSIKSQITALYYVGMNEKLPLITRSLIVITVAYALSPVDLIPDFIPILGYLDDLILLPVLISLTIRSIPNDLMVKAKEEARQNPISLKKNWKAGIIVILVWVSLISILVYKLVRV
ncbi:MAG: DUF1232 domain-containing protein [Spirochaetales bacterium]|nr:DUF1232 domain-containing protein [Spirochaetales bacterium]